MIFKQRDFLKIKKSLTKNMDIQMTFLIAQVCPGWVLLRHTYNLNIQTRPNTYRYCGVLIFYSNIDDYKSFN